MSSPTFLWKGLGTSTTLLVSQPRNLTAAAKSLQSCLTLCDPIDSSPPASPIPGILHARTLEWVAISFCNAWKWKVKVKSLSHVRLLATPWTAANQGPPSTGFSRLVYAKFEVLITWSVIKPFLGLPTSFLLLIINGIDFHLKYSCKLTKRQKA